MTPKPVSRNSVEMSCNIPLEFIRREWLAIALTAAYIVPVWLVRFLPTQDGPSHLYNAQIIREFANPAFDFQRYYHLSFALFPNWIAHALLALLMIVFQPLVAEKLLISLYVILFPICTFYFIGAVNQGNRWLGLLCFPLIYNYFLLKGFYSFAFAVPLFALVLGYWWKWKDQMTWRKVFVMNLLMVFLFFCHLVPYATAVFSILLLSVVIFRTQWRKIAWSMAVTLPSTLVFINYYFSSSVVTGIHFGIDTERIASLLKDLANMYVLVSYDETQLYFSRAFSILVLVLILFSLWKEMRRGVDGFRAHLDQRGGFLVLYLAMMVLYLIVPGKIGSGTYLNDRLALLAFIVLLGWLRTDFPARLRPVALSVVVLFSLLSLTWLGFDFIKLNRGLEEFTEATSHIGSHKVILPIFSNAFGASKRVGIYVNAANYYALDKGNINLGNYEVQYDVFPVKFRDDFPKPVSARQWVQVIHWQPERIDLCRYAPHVDLILIWGVEKNEVFYPLQECFRQVFVNAKGTLKLYEPNRK